MWRSSGNRLLAPAEIARMDVDKAMRYFNTWSFNEVYDYGKHVAIGEAMEDASKLPTGFMAIAPQSTHPDVWTDITRMRTLNTMQSQRNESQHLCPLQFDVVERLIERYTNKGDEVLDPFGGIMTVPYMANKMNRRGYGIELCEDYWRTGIGYLREVELKQNVPTLFDMEDVKEKLAS